MESLLKEIEQLKAALAIQKEKNERLDEECDSLAMDNERLRKELAKFSRTHYPPPPPVTANDTGSISQGPSEISPVVVVNNNVDVFEDNNTPYPNLIKKRITNANDGKNVISTTFFSDLSNGHNLVFSGGVDATIRGYDLLTGVQLLAHRATAPVLVLQASPPYVAAGMMDGSFVIMKLYPFHDDEDDMNASHESPSFIMNFKDHNKYIIALSWSQDGKYVATAGNDKVINIYQQNEMGEFAKWKSLIFENTPECLAFTTTHTNTTDTTPASSSSSTSTAAAADIEEDASCAENTVIELIVGLRGVPYLTYYTFPSVSTTALTARHVSLNVNDWDTHVSFTALFLAPSPNQKYLLVATDHHQLYLYKLGTNIRVKVLVGHNCGEYGKPMVIWDPSSSYCYINSEEENAVYVYSIAREKMIERLLGHKGIVRSLAYHPTLPYLVSASYDKSLIIWEPTVK